MVFFFLQARNANRFLASKRRPNEAVIITGDFNGHHHTVRELAGRCSLPDPRVFDLTGFDGDASANSDESKKEVEPLKMWDCFEPLGVFGVNNAV